MNQQDNVIKLSKTSTSKLEVHMLRRKKFVKLEKKYNSQIKHRILLHIFHEDGLENQ